MVIMVIVMIMVMVIKVMDVTDPWSVNVIKISNDSMQWVLWWFCGFCPPGSPLGSEALAKVLLALPRWEFFTKKKFSEIPHFFPEDLSTFQAVIVVHFNILNEYYSSFFPKTCQFTKRGFPLRHPRVARLPERGGRSSKRWSWRQLLRGHWTIVKIVQNAERIRWTGPLQWKV